MRWRKLLYPLSLPYYLITALRNWAFDNSILKSREFEVPVIAIGNLSTGGTGKTPMTEFLIKHFTDVKIGLVSRGYGRKTKGLILAKPEHGFDKIGDEPYQILQKFPHLKLALAEKRVVGIEALLENSKPELILLDDAYQHRYVKAGFNILLTTFDAPFYKDLVLPAGNLREGRNGKNRADVIVVTKCPDDLSPVKAKEIKRKLKPLDRQSVYFSGLEYAEPVNHVGVALLPDQNNTEVTILTGIANPAPMLAYLKNRYAIVRHLNYPDHHNFTTADLKEIEALCMKGGNPIITTEKDWVRLKGLLSTKVLDQIFYLPMQVKILFNEERKLLSEIQEFISK